MGNRKRKGNSNTGRHINECWGLNVKHALYSIDGKFYMRLKYFPGALIDPNGYVIFETESDFERNVHVGDRIFVSQGIRNLPGYQPKPRNLHCREGLCNPN
jgi:hypothetical protein